MSRILTLLSVFLVAGGTQAQTLLTPGQDTTFTLNRSSVTANLAIDVPSDARRMKLQLQAGSQDVILLVRYGEAFSLTGNAGTFGGVEWLVEQAHFRSFGVGLGSQGQWLEINRWQPQPLRAGRWHLAVLNFSPTAANVTIRAELANTNPGPVPIDVVFDDTEGCSQLGDEDQPGTTEPWFDSTAVTPVDGNPGTTLGEQRRNAFLRGMEQISEQLGGSGPVRVRACWRNLGGTDERTTLASAAPFLFRDDLTYAAPMGAIRSVEKPYTWYSLAGVAQQSGTDFCRYARSDCRGDHVDLFIQFNADVDTDDVLGDARFYYGYGAPTAPGQIDFIATTMHEITHGLGFSGLLQTDPDGSEPVGSGFRTSFGGVPESYAHTDAYTDATVYVDNQGQVREMTRLPVAQRAEALVSGTRLRWADPEAVVSTENPHRNAQPPNDLPRLYAPGELEPGSTFSHLSPFGQPGQLMQPFIVNGTRSLGLAKPMLSAVGWRQSDRAPPTQTYPYGGNWYDPARSNHGIDLHRVSGTPDTYFLILYTFDEDGLPEWFYSIGRIVDGVFIPGSYTDNEGRDISLWRRVASNGNPNLATLDSDAQGQVRIDFAHAARAPECNDGTARSGPLALMSFALGDGAGEPEFLRWCLSQIVPSDQRPDFDRSGNWYAGSSDSGWGVTTLNWNLGDGTGLFAVVYYFDALGNPRWAATQSRDFQPGATMELRQVQGYCRTCPRPAGQAQSVPVGTLQLQMAPPAGSSGQVSVDVQFEGPGGGQFQRNQSPLVRLGQSEPGR